MYHHVLKKKDTLIIQTGEDPMEERSYPQPVEGLKKVEVDGAEKTLQIGAALPDGEAKIYQCSLQSLRSCSL